jgi:diguanylate cyclase
MTVLLPLLIGAAIGGLLGMLAGWLARGREEVIVEKVVTQTVEKVVEAPAEAPDPLREQASEILAQLQELTFGVSEKIDAHARTVGDINEELTLAGADEGSAVLTAIRRLIDSNNEMQQQLHSAQAQINEQANQLKAQKEEARTDPLTKLRNRRAFDDELARRVADFERRGTPVQLMLLDVDHFKKFNDTYGHLAGDEVLRVVGRVLMQETHDNPQLFAARYGGEEFALLLGSSALDAAAQIGDRIRGLIGGARVKFESQALTVTASVGCAQLAKQENVSSFIARADEALYAAKKAGRNCACVHEEGNVRKVTSKPLAVSSAGATAADGEAGDDLGQSLARRIAEWRRGGVPVSMIVARLDNTATLESNLGRAGLEKAKDAIRQVFKAHLREMDQVSNVSAEVLGLLLPTARLIDAIRTAERIRSAIDSRDCESRVGSRITLSLGVAEVGPDDDSDTLLTRARRAMEMARRRGGNVVYINDGLTSDPAQDRLDLLAVEWAATR